MRNIDTNPRRIDLFIFMIINQIHLIWTEKSLAVPTTNQYWRIFGFGRSRVIPSLGEILEDTRHGSNKHQMMMKQLYSYPRLVELTDSDVVIETGAYVGGFTMMAAEVADSVIAIDPAAYTETFCQQNLKGYSNVSIEPVAAWSCETQINLNIAHYQNENSILVPDKGATGDSYTVPALPIPDIANKYGISQIDFLKIEAEGVEVEILRGALDSNILVKKIVVDVSPEQDGESPDEEVIELLESNGYVWKRKEEGEFWETNFIFARFNN
jgi:FkbM family methyltransferase